MWRGRRGRRRARHSVRGALAPDRRPSSGCLLGTSLGLERGQFVRYNPHVIRYLAFSFSGFFAGIAGALAAINFEIANSAYLGAEQSGTVLFATYIGGIGFFIGPIVGAIFVTF